jgi:hypothetical protein
MVFPESWKRSCPNFYAHDCTYCERALHILIHLFPLDYKPANKGPKNYVVSRPDDLNLIKEEQKRSDGK